MTSLPDDVANDVASTVTYERPNEPHETANQTALTDTYEVPGPDIPDITHVEDGGSPSSFEVDEVNLLAVGEDTVKPPQVYDIGPPPAEPGERERVNENNTATDYTGRMKCACVMLLEDNEDQYTVNTDTPQSRRIALLIRHKVKLREQSRRFNIRGRHYNDCTQREDDIQYQPVLPHQPINDIYATTDRGG